MKTKQVAILHVRKTNKLPKSIITWASVIVMFTIYFITSCSKNDDFVLNNDEIVIDYPNPDNTSNPGDSQIPSDQESKIIYTDIEPDFELEGDGFYNLDLNNDGIVDFKFSSFNTDTSSIFAEPNINTNRTNAFVAVSGPFWSYVIPLDNNTKIFNSTSQSNSFFDAYDCLLYMDFWNGKTDKYIGLRFLINGKRHYGWARLDFTNTTNRVFKDYAYNATPDMQILAGQKN